TSYQSLNMGKEDRRIVAEYAAQHSLHDAATLFSTRVATISSWMGFFGMQPPRAAPRPQPPSSEVLSDLPVGNPPLRFSELEAYGVTGLGHRRRLRLPSTDEQEIATSFEPDTSLDIDAEVDFGEEEKPGEELILHEDDYSRIPAVTSDDEDARQIDEQFWSP